MKEKEEFDMQDIKKEVIKKDIGIAVFTIFITALIVLAGVSGKKILFINGPRSAVITLGIMGMFFCMISVGKFISSGPAHPLTIAGYIFGTVALLILLTQIIKWQIPYIQNPTTALYILAFCILLKTIIARFINIVK